MTGSDSAWGYNLGTLINVTPDTRVGLSYRSKIKYNLNGTVSFSNVPSLLSGVVVNGDVTMPVTMPDTASISAFHQLSDKWDIMADATWTDWSVLQQLVITRTNGVVVQTTQENWRNTWRVAAGASYHYNEQWTVPPWRCIRPDAGSRCIPHCPYSGQQSHMVGIWRPVQKLTFEQD